MDEKTRDAREVAFLIAKGLMPNEVAQKVDLPLAYVDELTESVHFRTQLETTGGKRALDQWDEYKLERQATSSLRTKVRNNLDTYFEILDDIAQDVTTKPEIRKDIIFRLMNDSGVLREQGEVVQTQELPPSFFLSLAAANEEIEVCKNKPTGNTNQ